MTIKKSVDESLIKITDRIDKLEIRSNEVDKRISNLEKSRQTAETSHEVTTRVDDIDEKIDNIKQINRASNLLKVRFIVINDLIQDAVALITNKLKILINANEIMNIIPLTKMSNNTVQLGVKIILKSNARKN